MTKDKKGYYRDYVYRKDGTRKWFSGKSSQAVKKKMQAYQEENEPSLVTFEKVAGEWWEDINRAIAPTTAHGYESHYRRMPSYLPKRIAEIKPVDVQKAVFLYQKTYALGQKSTATFLQIMRQVFSFAVVNGYIETSPAREVSVPRGLAKRKVSMPSAEDIARIKESRELEGGGLAFFALYTGMRRGELLALEWSDIDFDRRVITVNKSLYWSHNRPYVKTPKTDAGTREIPIVDKLYEAMPKRGKGLVFGKNGCYLSASEVLHLWDRYRAASGVSCSLHQLRHAFATMLYEVNLPPKDAQKVLGHAQYSTTADIYTDIRKEREKAVSGLIRGIDL